MGCAECHYDNTTQVTNCTVCHDGYALYTNNTGYPTGCIGTSRYMYYNLNLQ